MLSIGEVLSERNVKKQHDEKTPSIKNGFTQISNKLLLSKKLTIYEKYILIVIKAHMMNKKSSFPAIDTIADEVPCSERQVVYIINKLIENRYLVKETRIVKGRQTSNRYKFNMEV